MERRERFEMLMVVWGPPPSDPGDRSVWKHGLWLLSEVPDLVEALVIEEGSVHETLTAFFGLEGLAELEAAASEHFLCNWGQEEVRNATVSVLSREPWVRELAGLTAFRRTRLVDRLADDVALKMALAVLRNPPLRGWFGADW